MQAISESLSPWFARLNRWIAAQPNLGWQIAVFLATLFWVAFAVLTVLDSFFVLVGFLLLRFLRAIGASAFWYWLFAYRSRAWAIEHPLHADLSGGTSLVGMVLSVLVLGTILTVLTHALYSQRTAHR